MRTALIYGLIDPRDGEIRYVGQTRDTLARRLAAHVSDARCAVRLTAKLRWIRDLLDADERPEAVVLEVVAYAARLDAERAWIARLGDDGRLTNAPHPGRQTTVKC